MVFLLCSGALMGDCRPSSWCSVGFTPVFLHILHLAARSQCGLRQRPCETATPPDGKSRISTEDGRLPRHPGQKPRSTPSAPQRSLPPDTWSTLRGWRIFARQCGTLWTMSGRAHSPSCARILLHDSRDHAQQKVSSDGSRSVAKDAQFKISNLLPGNELRAPHVHAGGHFFYLPDRSCA